MKKQLPVNCTSDELQSYISSLGSGAEFSGGCYLDTAPSVPSKSITTAGKSCGKESKMAACPGSPCSKTSSSSTGSPGKVSLTSSVGDSLVSPQELWCSVEKGTEPSNLWLLEISYSPTKVDGVESVLSCLEKMLNSESSRLKVSLESSQLENTHSGLEQEVVSGTKSEERTSENFHNQSGMKHLNWETHRLFLKPYPLSATINDHLNFGGWSADTSLMGGVSEERKQGREGKLKKDRDGLLFHATEKKVKNSLKESGMPGSTRPLSVIEPLTNTTSQIPVFTASSSRSARGLKVKEYLRLPLNWIKVEQGNCSSGMLVVTGVETSTENHSVNSGKSSPSVKHLPLGLLCLPNELSELLLQSTSTKASLLVSSKVVSSTPGFSGVLPYLTITVRPLWKVSTDGKGYVEMNCAGGVKYGIFPSKKTNPTPLTEQSYTTVKATARPEKRRGNTISGICGQTPPVSFAKWNRDSRSWKTCRGFLPLTISAKSLVTWRKWGSMRNGELYQRRALVHGTPAIDCGYLRTVRMLPTPVAYDATLGGPNNHYKGLGNKARHGGFVPQSLSGNRLLPTPTTSNTIRPSEDRLKKLRDGETTRNVPTGGEPCNLQERVILLQRGWLNANGLLPTMSASNGLRGGSKSQHFPYMLGSPKDAESGMLNPEWVEWLMGFPPLWTESKPSGIHKFRKWLQQLS